MSWSSKKLVVLFLGVLAGCSHSATKNVLTPDFLLSPNYQQVTFLGDNAHPRFSPDNARLIYSSRRNNHRGSQIYEMDLLKKKERRMTFSDGDAFDPIYISDNEVLYASTTDEIKEGPLLNHIFNKDFPPSDIYMSDLYGTDILRLSKQPGYDGELLFMSHPQKPAIFFTSRRGELLGIYRLDLQKLPVSLVSAQKEKEKRYPALTSDHQYLAWAEKDLKTSEESLILLKLKGKVPRVLKSGEGQYRDLFFAPKKPDRLFYSILRKGEKKYQLEVYSLDTQCTQVVFKGADSLFYPTISNENNERLAFVRLFQDKKQIYVVPLPSDLGPCLETPAQDTLKK